MTGKRETHRRNLWPFGAFEAQMAAVAGKPPNPFVFRLGDMAPNRETKSGTVRIADSTNFLISKTVAASMVTIKPGGMREMHWHPNADEWLYILTGAGRATVFNTGPAAITTNFHAVGRSSLSFLRIGPTSFRSD